MAKYDPQKELISLEKQEKELSKIVDKESYQRTYVTALIELYNNLLDKKANLVPRYHYQKKGSTNWRYLEGRLIVIEGEYDIFRVAREAYVASKKKLPLPETPNLYLAVAKITTNLTLVSADGYVKRSPKYSNGTEVEPIYLSINHALLICEATSKSITPDGPQGLDGIFYSNIEKASVSTYKLRDVRAALLEVRKELKGISTKKTGKKTVIKKRR